MKKEAKKTAKKEEKPTNIEKTEETYSGRIAPPKVSVAQSEEYRKLIEESRKEIKKIFLGQDEVVTALVRGLLCNCHVLLEGIPGIAKTLLIRALAKVAGGKFSRIQFTVDLLPTDIVGITTYTEQKGFYTVKGPLFANFV